MWWSDLLPPGRAAEPESPDLWQLQNTNGDDASASPLHVVLFGVGDLRVDDHVGLQRAVASGQPVLPLFVLDNNSFLKNVPGAVAHTVDTASLLAKALEELDASLRELHPALALHTVMTDETDGEGSSRSSMTATIQEYVASLLAASSSDASTDDTPVTVHVCDLGPVDNEMGYGALGQLQQQDESSTNNNLQIVTWDNHLRDWSQTMTTRPTRFRNTKPVTCRAKRPFNP